VFFQRKAPKPLTTKPVSKKSRKSKGLLSRIHRQMEKEKRSGLFSKEEVRLRTFFAFSLQKQILEPCPGLCPVGFHRQ